MALSYLRVRTGKLPVHSQQLVLRGWFSLAGQAMAHVIAHTNFVIVGLAKPVATYLETGCTEIACATVTMDDIPDLEIKESKMGCYS